MSPLPTAVACFPRVALPGEARLRRQEATGCRLAVAIDL
jgi:hypothetical protein